MGNFKFKKEDYILYILNHIEPEKSDLWRLNKIAFLVEFAYIYFNEKDLSDAQYAAITHGAVLDDYKLIFKSMGSKKLIKLDGYNIRVITDKKVIAPETISNFIDQKITKYSGMTNGELKAITHATDSYKITTKNEKVMGGRIKKSLALLETFFEEGNDEGSIELKENELPRIDRAKLVEYEP